MVRHRSTKDAADMSGYIDPRLKWGDKGTAVLPFTVLDVRLDEDGDVVMVITEEYGELTPPDVITMFRNPE